MKSPRACSSASARLRSLTSRVSAWISCTAPVAGSRTVREVVSSQTLPPSLRRNRQSVVGTAFPPTMRPWSARTAAVSASSMNA
ncbi:MAG: hypothetical protein QM767_19495 [Anaeromyxobacter sp.]